MSLMFIFLSSSCWRVSIFLLRVSNRKESNWLVSPEHLWTVCLLLLSICDQVLPITFDSVIEWLNFILNHNMFTFPQFMSLFFTTCYRPHCSKLLSSCFWCPAVSGSHRLLSAVWKFILSKEKTLFSLILCIIPEVESFFSGNLWLYFCYHVCSLILDLFSVSYPVHLSYLSLSPASFCFSIIPAFAHLLFLSKNLRGIFEADHDLLSSHKS